VQFTRNPAGLAGALKKIGELARGSRLESPHAEEASHLFFANGMSESIFGFATHPPLIERIRALDPSFDGNFSKVKISDATSAIPPAPREQQPFRPPPIPGLPLMQTEIARVAPLVVAQQDIVAGVGRPMSQHLRYAVELHDAIPPSLEAATRDPLGACALLCAFLLSNEPAARQKQLDDLARAPFEATRQETMRIWPQVQAIPRQARIPLVDLALPALRRLSPQQFEQFRAAVKTLVESDRETDLFEYMLQKIVVRHLESYFFPARRPITQFYDLRPLAKDCSVLLAAMAYAGQEDATQAHRAFLQGANLLSHVARSEIPWLPPDRCDLSHLDLALERLSQALPQCKKNVLNACAQTVAADGIIQEREAELLRAIGDALDCPVPPFVRRQEGAPLAA
jgi:hypothetical protein